MIIFRVLLILGLFAMAGCGDLLSSDSQNTLPESMPVADADVEGPVSGSPDIISTFISLAGQGYQQAEFFITGVAGAYSNRSELNSDGLWYIQEADQAAYTTRIVVYRPIDPADFNGTVVVEWLNVSGGFDTAPDWTMAHTELIRQGYVWVGVSAQKVGVDALKAGAAAQRYETMNHPGDAFSYDMYSQIGKTLRQPLGVDPLQGLQAEIIIAMGESQSANRMTTYVNAFAPVFDVFDGYFIHSRTSGSSALSQAPQVDIATPGVVRVRTDFPRPVMMLQTESDLFALGSYPDRQDDTANFRLWEVAGTAHADLYTFLIGRLDLGTNPSVAAVVENAAPIPGIIDCDLPVNAGPQNFVLKAAISAFNRWIRDGVLPPTADRLAVGGSPAALLLDDLGNALGGIRTSYVDAPIAVLSGEGNTGAGFCFLAGTTALFDTSTLASLYTDNEAYIEAVNNATDDAVAKGFLLEVDGALIKDYAASTDIFAP